MTQPQLSGFFSLISLERVDSTNEEAKRLAEGGGLSECAVLKTKKLITSMMAERGAPSGCVIWAKEQTHGKGRRGRTWVSEPGNLYCSIIFRLEVPAAKAVQLSFLAANAIAEALIAVLPRGTHVACKWPNDVLVEGRKVAGILIETSPVAPGEKLKWIVIGIGVNVANYPKDVEFPATSLAEQGSEDASVERLLESICKRIQNGLATWKKLSFASIRKNWLSRAHGIGQPVSVRLEGETLEGIFDSLDNDGALVLRQNGEKRKITAGDVFFSSS
jgi:BirA family transcriptional regulator, biotin operon repressor / biotin---[acetyl-CoA-carboxylase] ligase